MLCVELYITVNPMYICMRYPGILVYMPIPVCITPSDELCAVYSVQSRDHAGSLYKGKLFFCIK